MNQPRGVEGVGVFKIFLFLALAAILFIRAEGFLAILVGSHLGNIPVKSESHWPKGLGADTIIAFIANSLRFSIFSSG